MKIVLDTNVFVSGVFFSGPPCQILKAWQNKEFQIVISLETIDEYLRVGKEVSAQHFKNQGLIPDVEYLFIDVPQSRSLRP